MRSYERWIVAAIAVNVLTLVLEKCDALPDGLDWLLLGAMTTLIVVSAIDFYIKECKK